MSDGAKGTESSEIGIEEVLRLLPHRYPMLLVDRAADYVAMKSIRGFKCVTFNEPFFQGHFPGKPVMPGVLLIEAMAQTGAILMSKSLNVDVEKNVVFFMSVDGARFRQPVIPGDVIELNVEATGHRQNVFKFKGEVLVRGRRAAEAEFAAMVMPREQ
jgi:3-hydroxyacyl-[acyl-carrier-protein] dehydratase